MEEQKIILFDGVCNLCNGVVQFVIKQDKKAVFRFSSLQSDFGQGVLAKHHFPVNELNSFIFLKGEKLYIKSNAALEMCKELGGFWIIIYGFKIIPRFIRDWVYDTIAKNRYRWFGKQESCWLPTPELKARFI